MIQIALCDDNRIHLEVNEKLVKETAGETPCRIQSFLSAESLLSEMEKNEYSPDIAILDIEMDGVDGITLAKKMNALDPQCRIIFMTSYQDYAQDAYEADHIWYVLKKDAEKYFSNAWNKAIRSLKEKESTVPGIIVREKGTNHFVPLDQIIYLSKADRKAEIVCADRSYYDTRRPAQIIPKVMEAYFIRCHQSYWINREKIKALDHEEFVLEDGTRIPISRSFREDARKQFFEKYR